MNQALSIRPTQAERALVVLAALGFTALVGFAALEPATEPARAAIPSAPTDVARSADRDTGVHMVEPGVLAGESAQRFERSNEPATEVDPANAHGG